MGHSNATSACGRPNVRLVSRNDIGGTVLVAVSTRSRNRVSNELFTTVRLLAQSSVSSHLKSTVNWRQRSASVSSGGIVSPFRTKVSTS
jgi:hypothetical protein